ncbi:MULTISPECIES: ketoacyl-ACP synthase III family protein [unclassified Streptomyces]|uniref:ketoacyl-ACP synthase III family protein n=1 Tax=unclassified Streptomyces TaxID=2593676 RepID=UPI00037E9BC7|nr:MULTISPECIES: ketoacyl-ACP synthase III family protein [unclassified Streptomyces]MYT32497.1 3-oxoacyl-ACP synthase [Streptomyces sp. SID8354]
MWWNDLYVSASGAWLGRREDVRDAVAEGRYDAAEAARDDYLAVRVSDDVHPPDMAVAAARLALARSAVPAGDVALVAHASVGFQGRDHWVPASYIQARTVAGSATALDIRQASNGGLAALDLAASWLAARPESRAALVTTADRYGLPEFDRYRSDSSLARGDGATAVVLSRGPRAATTAVARLLSTVLLGDSTHEGAYRGMRPWGEPRGGRTVPVDLRARTWEYLATGATGEEVVATLTAGQQRALEQALSEAGVKADEVARFVYPNGRWWHRDLEPGRTTWEWGRQVGHIGAGDQAAGFTHLVETRAVAAGDYVVLSGSGVGMNFGCAVLEMLRTPDWESAEDALGRDGRTP